MNQSIVGYVATNLLNQGPLLLAYSVGILVSIHYMSKFPGPARWALAASSILLIISMVVPFVLGFTIMSGQFGPRSSTNLALISGIVGFIASCCKALSFGILLVAVFVDRPISNNAI